MSDGRNVSRNHWMCLADAPFAAWEIRFPSPRSLDDLHGILQVAQQILKYGEQEDVYRVLEVGRPMNFRASDDLSYSLHLEQSLRQTEVLQLFNFGIGAAQNPGGQLRTPGRLCYYDSAGRLTEDQVENLGLLLRDLRPDDAEWGERFMEQVPPVIVVSDTARLDHRGVGEVRIRIELATDIWFPRVLGILDGTQPLPPAPRKWYDNSELAFSHTPRLNNFLRGVHACVLNAGAAWHLREPEGLSKQYESMVRESTVSLD